MKQRVAFTLVEMLAVVSILGLLIAMMLPSFMGAMEFTRRTNCLNNLKQIGIGFYNYQGANHGCMPPFCSSADSSYDWIWTDTLGPYTTSGKAAGPGAQSGTNYPGKSIWACPDAQFNPATGVSASGGFRTNYANTCGSLATDTWTPAPNNAGLVMSDGLHQSTGTFDSFRICNRYNQMDARSILVYCGCYGCGLDPGFPDPAGMPSDWNLSAKGTPDAVIIPFAHRDQNPALTVNGSVKSYGRGVKMGVGTGNRLTDDTWVPAGN